MLRTVFTYYNILTFKYVIRTEFENNSKYFFSNKLIILSLNYSRLTSNLSNFTIMLYKAPAREFNITKHALKPIKYNTVFACFGALRERRYSSIDEKHVGVGNYLLGTQVN